MRGQWPVLELQGQERARDQSLSEIAKTHRISRATVSRLLKQAKAAAIEVFKRGAAGHLSTPLIQTLEISTFCCRVRCGF
jgi:hypothetical protein